MKIMFSQGEPPIFNAAVEYKVVAWGLRDEKEYVFFNTGEMVVSSPLANALDFSEEQKHILRTEFPIWPMRPLPECSQ